ncbi:MAG: YwiC-like family protein [Microthrixaceae bacterium]|nr:YwiC-like family protein [Microthrixaceae bacterium]
MSENSATVPTLSTGSANLQAADRRGATAQARPGWRSVTVPTEHGGWGLTLEPGLLGLLVAPGMTSLWLALAAMVAFTARTPLKIVAVDLRRNRVLPRTRLAGMIGLAELAVLAAFVTAAVNTASHPFWWPLMVAAPLVALEAVYEVRSKGRRLAPELAGAIGVCSVAAMAVLADGASATLAVGLWLILAARALTSVSWVRGQITRIHGRSPDQLMLAATDVVTVAMGLTAVLLEQSLLLGALALPVVIAIQRTTAIGDPVRPAVQGMIQMFMGLAVVAATAIGVAVL